MKIQIGEVSFTISNIDVIIEAMKKKLSRKESLEEFYEAFIDRWNFRYAFLGIPPEEDDIRDIATLIAVINFVLKQNKTVFRSIGEALEYINENIDRAINRILNYKLSETQAKMYATLIDFFKKCNES